MAKRTRNFISRAARFQVRRDWRAARCRDSRCPTHRLDPAHYRTTGLCRCVGEDTECPVCKGVAEYIETKHGYDHWRCTGRCAALLFRKVKEETT